MTYAAPARTYAVHWVPDMHSWLFDGRLFEHVDLAKGAAQFEHDIRARAAADDAEGGDR
jgi:beta-glucanase (GH16 family)